MMLKNFLLNGKYVEAFNLKTTAKESRLIRSISELNLRESAEKIAYELIKQIDMPIVFWIDSELDKNYAGRHPVYQNEFWVIVKPQDNQDEFERLILVNLYRGIQEKNRYRRIWFENDYKEYLEKKGNHKQLESYYYLLGVIGSLVTSLDTEMYFEQFGIQTSKEVLQKKMDNVIESLNEYLQKRQKNPGFHWYRETEISNLLEIGNLYRRNAKYQQPIKKILKKINPLYLAKVGEVSRMLLQIKKEYTGDNGAELNEKMLYQIRKQFNLEKMVRLYIPLTNEGKIRVKDGETGKVVSFIPEDYPEQELLIRWVREANLFVETLRETSICELPSVEMQLTNLDRKNAYSNGGEKNGYYICFTVKLIVNVTKKIFEEDIEDKEILLRFVIFFITAHEYAHILHGDCEKESSDKEKKADEKAIELVKQIIPFLYRTHPKPEDRIEEYGYYWMRKEYDKMYQILNGMSVQRIKEINEEMQGLLSQWRRDFKYLKKAIEFVTCEVRNT